MLKKIKYLLTLILTLVIFYVFTAMYSFHQLHKGIFYNDKKLIDKYIEWESVRGNVKNYINIKILNKPQSEEKLNDLSDIEILLSGFAGKFIEIAIDTYLNSNGIILLLEKSQKKSEIPKPSFLTLIGCPLIMHNNGINSFYINYEIEGKKYPIYFLRNGIRWKIIKIEFPKKIFGKIK